MENEKCCEGECEGCQNHDAERQEMVAKELLGSWMAIVHHVSGCEKCWARWVETVKCMEEAFNATFTAARRSDSEQGKDAGEEVPEGV